MRFIEASHAGFITDSPVDRFAARVLRAPELGLEYLLRLTVLYLRRLRKIGALTPQLFWLREEAWDLLEMLEAPWADDEFFVTDEFKEEMAGRLRTTLESVESGEINAESIAAFAMQLESFAARARAARRYRTKGSVE